jgi:hypothetical protein
MSGVPQCELRKIDCVRALSPDPANGDPGEYRGCNRATGADVAGSKSAQLHFGNCLPVSTSCPCVLPTVKLMLRLAMSVAVQL